MQKSQAEYMEEVKAIKAKQEELWNNTNRFHSQIRKEHEMLAREIQEVKKGQINQTLVNNQRAEAEKNLEQVVERQARDISEMRKQLNLWTRNASARKAYSCWAHQQANPNLSEIPSKRKLGKQEKRKTELQGKNSYSVNYRVLTPRRHYPRLRVAEPQGLFGLNQYPTPRHDARRLGVDEAARKRTLHRGLNA
ncbi:hypothetical protein PIB30_077048 [Stylosanthes scabra]|uniref:Uncharacterized protein n=1 Tax=Stylosanthes scabra TaxID=79078 RepID=A0ABU6VTX1_9FABA|nr:hypothetical protein [Stylosanthes scabra]